MPDQNPEYWGRVKEYIEETEHGDTPPGTFEEFVTDLRLWIEYYDAVLDLAERPLKPIVTADEYYEADRRIREENVRLLRESFDNRYKPKE